MADASDAARLYGVAAATVAGFLLCFGLWTIACNILVIAQAHFVALEWALAATTILSVAIGWWLLPHVARAYRVPSSEGWHILPPVAGREPGTNAFAFLIPALALGFLAADIGNRTLSAAPYMAVMIIAAALLGYAWQRGAIRLERLPPEIGWRLPTLLVLMFAIYYFAHRVDGDDANFINLAARARTTAFGVFQVDTMLGDGPHLIHLPSYKFHSFELLGAVLASWTGLPTIAVIHLLLPALQIPVLAAIVLLIFGAAAGRLWFAAALFWLAFLFFNEVSGGGYGAHGLVRLYQGKGFLVSALLPLIAALTARWMIRGDRIDLVGLALANACAVGFSANGIYGGPAASGFVAVAIMVVRRRDRATWINLLGLVPTLAWPLIAAGLIVTLKLAYPSEVTHPTLPIDQLNFVVGYGLLGRLTLAVLAVAGIGLFATSLAAEAIVYLLLAMLLTLNPLSWTLISAATGNLGFRIFWSIPIAFLLALATVNGLRIMGLKRESLLVLAGILAIGGSLLYLHRQQDALATVSWHRPGLKVIRPDWELAERLAARTTPGCSILAPEIYSMLIAMQDDAPRPVFVRSLYMIHYRFTMPPAERALRSALIQAVDGAVGVAPPDAAALATLAIPIGTVAVRDDGATRESAARIAKTLSLSGPVKDGPLLIWTGQCHGAPGRSDATPQGR